MTPEKGMYVKICICKVSNLSESPGYPSQVTKIYWSNGVWYTGFNGGQQKSYENSRKK